MKTEKTLCIECAMGAAGDMLMAALSMLLPEPEAFIERMNALGIPGVRLTMREAVRCGIVGRAVSVQMRDGVEEESLDVHAHEHAHGEHDHAHETHSHEHAHPHEVHSHDHDGHHHHSGMRDIAEQIDALPVSDTVKAHALSVYQLIADAEAHAHGKPVEQIHFHEVGTLDAIADIVGVCMLMEELSPTRIVVSPVHVGSGQVRCAHGILPVPAPATAHILRGVPTYGGEIRGELCTPTGAALLRHFATAFGPQPMMAVEAIGYGMGKKEFPAANCVRALLGSSGTQGGPNDSVVELCCNLDDMTGEALGYAQKALMKSGALDVYCIPIMMKKSRPGHMLCCLCKETDADGLAECMLQNTTTLGVRRAAYARYALERTITPVETQYGRVRMKSSEGYGVKKRKAEYRDVQKAAKLHQVPLDEVIRAADQAYGMLK